MKYKIVGDAQGLQQDPDHRIIFLLANYKCEPPKPGSPPVVSARMKLSHQAPNFNGMVATVTGRFSVDGTFQAQSINVPEIGFKASSLEWLTPFFTLVGAILFIVVGVWSAFGRDPWRPGILFIIAGVVLMVIAIYNILNFVKK
jgi:hypothetical protein